MTETSAHLQIAGSEALERGRVPLAIEAFESALALEESPLVRTVAGALRYADDDLEAARAHWELAFDLYRRSGERRPAARVAAMLADLHGGALGNEAAGRGWVQRGRRLLSREGRCVEIGYLELSVLACMRHDLDAVLRSAEVAMDLAAEFHDRELEIRALADSGLALVSQGHEREGFDRLDEALSAMVDGQVTDVEAIGKCLCSLLSACDRAGDLRRAEEATRLVAGMLTDRLDGRPRLLHTHCRNAYGSVLCGMGRWREAEEVLADAMGPTSSVSDYHRMLTSGYLADLRVMQGRLAEAADLLRPYQDRVEPLGARARLHFAAGEHDLAVSLASAAIDALVGDVLRVAPVWALLVDIELARADLVAAQAAADRLGDLVLATNLGAIRAQALLASGRVCLAAGRHREAVIHLQRARTSLAEICRPMLRANIGRAFAEALSELDQKDLAVIEARAALEIFVTLGAQPDVDRTGALLRTLGAPYRSRLEDPRGSLDELTARERQVLALLCEGLTNIEIGQRLFVTAKTAEHHVGRILGKLGVRNRAQAAALCRRLEQTGRREVGV